MPGPLLVILSGLPATGKTTLGQRLARDLGLPFVYKDGIKEILFDTLGWKDRAWSKQLSQASNAVLLYVAEALLAAGQAVVVESNFVPEYVTVTFQRLIADYGARPVQIWCTAAPEILQQRFAARQRHPGHGDQKNMEEFMQILAAPPPQPLALGGPVLTIDTGRFEAIDYAALQRALQTAQAA